MNLAFLAAGLLALVGSGIHGFVGDRIVRRIEEDALPGNPFTGIPTKVLIRVTWHFVTIAFLVLGIALLVIGIAPQQGNAGGVAYVSGAAFACWGAFALAYGFRRGGIKVLRSHPGPIVFLLTTALIAWGSAQL